MPLIEATSEVVDRYIEDISDTPFRTRPDVERDMRWERTARRHPDFTERIIDLGRRVNLATEVGYNEPSLYSVVSHGSDLHVFRPTPRALLTLLTISEVFPDYTSWGRGGIPRDYLQEHIDYKSRINEVAAHLVEAVEPPSMDINDVTLGQVVKGFLGGELLPERFTRRLKAQS